MDSQLSMKWERILWKRQAFADNYVGPAFFRIKKRRPEVDIFTAMQGATTVSQEICSCLVLVAIFYGLAEKLLSPTALLLLACTLTSALYIIKFISLLTNQDKTAMSAMSCFVDLKVATFTCILLWFLSPVIQTLTGSVATDTIMACTTALLILHLIVHPYGAKVAIENPIMSSNLGIFASVCLASRLHNPEEVFALMISAVALFALFPSFRKFCKSDFPIACDLLMTVVIVMMTAAALFFYSPSNVCVLVSSLIICNFIVPMLFVYMQSYRQNIYGPWDEAQIKDK